MSNFVPTIGLEIHAELNTNSKMFCNSKNDPEEKHPNVNICSVCVGHPGTLPVINIEAVKKVMLVGFALNANVAKYAQFDRKNYYYPDLPKGYQITQYAFPLVLGGSLPLRSGKSINITRVHLEEDTGSLMHDEELVGNTKNSNSLVDFNRAGVPLMELVSEPNISSAEEAVEFAEELQLIIRYVGASHARMERGEMRVEANISVSKKGEGMGTKVEVKNLNSFKAVERAIKYETDRQIKLINSGGVVVQETRGWDESAQKTFSQRIKEEAHDYRYLPEPDLPPLKMDKEGGINLADIESALPELPWSKRVRLNREYGIDNEAIEILVRDKQMAAFFEESVSELLVWIKAKEEKTVAIDEDRAIKLMRNYLIADVNGMVKERNIEWDRLLLTPENFAELIKMILKDSVSSRGAKDILRIMIEQGGDPSDIAKEHGYEQTRDADTILKAMEIVKKNNEKAYQDYLNGNDKTVQFLIGQTMMEVKKAGKGANPEVVMEMWVNDKS